MRSIWMGCAVGIVAVGRGLTVRPSWLAALVAVGALVTGTAFAAETAAPSTWKAGLVRVKITPEKPLWAAGYASRNRPSEGKLHDLWIKVLALEDARQQRAVVVTSDLLGFPKAMADSVCAQVEKRYGLRRSQIMLTCSHTHSAPVLADALLDIYPLDDQQKAAIVEYSRQLETTVVKAVGDALAALAPATLWAGEGKAGFAANRRNNTEKDVIRLRKEGQPTKGPSDHSVPVLAVRAPDGRLLAALAIYACHNTTLAEYQWVGDYAGFYQVALEQKHPGTQAMFAIGCGADQNPMPRRSVELCQQYGDDLAKAVDGVLAKPMRPIASTLRTAFELVTLDFQGPPDVKRLQAQAVRKDYLGRWSKRILAEMAQSKATGKPLPTSYPYPVQAWRLGADQLWIALGGEVVVDYALSFKSKFGPTTWVTGYSNDVMSYIPSARIWNEGGYESGAFAVYGQPAERWAPDIEDRITAAATRLVTEAKR